MLLDLQKHIIYGPVKSRRLGRSLGINVLPVKKKICTFNCVYCQYGWTLPSGTNGTDHPEWVSAAEILSAIERGLIQCTPPPDYLTLSGNGEATMHPEFPAIVDGLIRIRNRFSPGTKTAILTNSTLINNKKIRAAIDRIEYKIMKLDAGTPAMLQQINRPTVEVQYEELISGLRGMKDIIIQTMWSAGTEGNFTPEHISLWLDKVKRIAPRFVQLYSLDRGYPSRNISVVQKEELLKIKQMVVQESISAEVY